MYYACNIGSHTVIPMYLDCNIGLYITTVLSFSDF